MKLGDYEEAIKCYNECFTQKAKEERCTIDQLRESLKQHKVKGYENIMFCYFFCLHAAKRITEAQWLQFVKSEARYGLIDAIRYCANNGIPPIEDHFDIYFTDRSQLKLGDYLYDDGSFAHEQSNSKKTIARVIIMPNSDYEISKGWNHGYLVPLHAVRFIQNGLVIDSFTWSDNDENLPFPHSHYTGDDIKHWNEIDKIESEDFITIEDYSMFPAFHAAAKCPVKIPISDTSGWVLPSIHFIKKMSHPAYFSVFPKVASLNYWTSSQSDASHAITFCPLYFHSFSSCVRIEPKTTKHCVLPIAAF